MSTPLRVLRLEDLHEDVRLMLRELRQAGYDPQAEMVDNEADFVRRLTPDVDIILSDYNLPQFSAPHALEKVAQSGIDIPVVVVTGSISGETADACIQQGAWPVERVVQHIRAGSGNHFDPRVVEAFASMHQEALRPPAHSSDTNI